MPQTTSFCTEPRLSLATVPYRSHGARHQAPGHECAVNSNMSVEEAFALVPAFKDTRIASLYSDFSHLQVYNPEGYEANCKAWKELITQCMLRHAFKSSFSIPVTLASAFLIPKYGEPKFLYSVVDQMVKESVLVPWSVFQTSSYSARSSLTDYLFPTTLVLRSWTSLKLSLYTLKSANHEEYFIHLPLLGSKAEETFLKLQEVALLEAVYLGKLFNEEIFINHLKNLDPNFSTIDAKAMILFLTRDTHKVKLLKKELPQPETYLKLDNSPITETDIGIINLKAAIEKVTARTALLEEKVDNDIPCRIQSLLSSANAKSDTTRSRAKNLLLQKARANKSLEHSSNLLEKLSDILDEINKAETNATMVSTLQSANSALSAFNERATVSEVDEVMVDMEEQISKTNEVSEALGMTHDEDLDTSDIERELETLEAEELQKKKSSSLARLDPEEKELLERLQKVLLKEPTRFDSGADTAATEAKKADEPQKIAYTT